MKKKYTRPIESFPPLSSEALPDTLPPKLKSGKTVYLVYWIGVTAFTVSAAICFFVIFMNYAIDTFYVVTVVFLTISLGVVFYLIKWLLDAYNGKK